jgi:hypothetical protein
MSCGLVEFYRLLGVLLGPEHGGITSVRNVGELLPDHKIPHSRKVFLTVTAARTSNFTELTLLVEDFNLCSCSGGYEEIIFP